jgi:hypothetical protein
MRSMDSILADEPSVHTLPEADESDSLPAGGSDAPQQAGEGVKHEPAAAKQPTKEGGDDEADEGPDPTDLTGFKRALAAARGDKRKMRKQWQEAEKRLARLEGQLAAHQAGATQPKQEQAAPKPEDLDEEFFGKGPGAYISAREQAIREEMQAQLFRQRAEFDEAIIRDQHEDYEDAKAAFAQAAAQAPWLWQQVQSSARPALTVYKEGKRLLVGAQGG